MSSSPCVSLCVMSSRLSTFRDSLILAPSSMSSFTSAATTLCVSPRVTSSRYPMFRLAFGEDSVGWSVLLESKGPIRSDPLVEGSVLIGWCIVQRTSMMPVCRQSSSSDAVLEFFSCTEESISLLWMELNAFEKSSFTKTLLAGTDSKILRAAWMTASQPPGVPTPNFCG